MKMSKEDRDAYVLEHQDKTRGELVTDTGWSLTTIKSVRKRLGVGVLTDRDTEIADYILAQPTEDDYYIAQQLGCKVDKVRDTKIRLGVYSTYYVTKKIKAVDSYVYLIHVRDDLYKVGKSNKPSTRISTLRCTSEEYSEARVVCMVWCADAFGVEREMLGSSHRFVNLGVFDGSTEWVRGDMGELMGRLVQLSCDAK
jgi:hypothetical protein